MTHRIQFASLILILLGIHTGCGSSDNTEGGPEDTGKSSSDNTQPANCLLADGLPSPQDLGLAIVEALNDQDKARLHSLRISKKEYLDYLWPEFPARENWPGEYAYANLNKNCIKGVNRWSVRFGDQNLTFVGIRFAEPMETYNRFNLLRGTVLRIRSEDGMEDDLDILGSVVEMGTCYKLLSYDEG